MAEETCEVKDSGPKMEWKPMRPSALVMAFFGTVQCIVVMAVHFGMVLWGTTGAEGATANPGLPEAVLSASVVGFLILLGQAIVKLCEDAPAPEPGEDKEITLKRLELEHVRESGSPAATVTITEETLKALTAKK